MSKPDTSSASAMSKKDCSSAAPLPSIIPPSEITFLKDLHPSRSEFTIKIRVLRAWNRMSFKNENEIYALEMLVVDEEGTRRQGTCLKTFLKKFGPLLQEGSTVIIKNPTLGDNLSSFKYVDCPHKICLYYDSKVIKCNDFLGSDNGFSFTPFSSILDKTFQNTQPIDVIGDVCVCYDTESFTGKNGKESVKRTMQLEDKEGNKIYVTLWDSYVHQFNDYISQNPGVTRVVLIIQFGKLSWFKDKPYVSNSYTVTKVFINHDFSEIQEFKTRVVTKGTVSYTGDNQTPNDAADMSIGKRPVSSESNETKKDARLELKRNLKEVYDVEDNDSASATKASPTIQPIQVQDGKFDFLIPKLEK
ncbi:putative replication protein A, OB [Helianthus annuus]|nr:putative replication protein A, OB [Helianthus annuus]KAJ0951698.1 putative replication protein A, OB [Helianthus annuus]